MIILFATNLNQSLQSEWQPSGKYKRRSILFKASTAEIMIGFNGITNSECAWLVVVTCFQDINN